MRIRPGLSSSIVILVMTAASLCFAQIDVPAIIQRSVEANARDWNANPQYNCFERDRDPHGSKTYQDLMLYGSPYQKLVAINGKPLSRQQQDEQENKMNAEIARRRAESPQQRAARIAQYQKDRTRDHLLMQQLTEAFDFRLIGELKLDGYEVYVLKATPKPGYKPPNTDTQVLKGMQGKMWIDKKTFQWVKVEAQVLHPVSIEGFLAQVEPGTRFELEKKPVDDDIWLPTHFSMSAKARIIHLFTHRSQENDTYYDYQKAPASSAVNTK